MNIVIPMVGLGKRFSDAGFLDPKPLINVNGKTIIQRALDSLRIDGNYFFIIRKSNYSLQLSNLLKKLKPSCKIIEIDYLTDGSVNSILLAKDFINTDEELITTNCDQELFWDSKKFINFCNQSNCDGVVVTYPYNDIVVGNKSPYSFIEMDSDGNGIKLEEKFAITDKALCGIHYWRRGRDFVSSSEKLIKNNDRVNNEFYVSKTYNYLIRDGKKIKSFDLKKNQFFSLGTPDDLKYYELLHP